MKCRFCGSKKVSGPTSEKHGNLDAFRFECGVCAIDVIVYDLDGIYDAIERYEGKINNEGESDE